MPCRKLSILLLLSLSISMFFFACGSGGGGATAATSTPSTPGTTPSTPVTSPSTPVTSPSTPGTSPSANPAPTMTLQVSPSTATFGQLVTLTWTSTNATSVTIDNGVGAVALAGSWTGRLTATTNFTGTATGSGGTAVGAATVTIVPGVNPAVVLTATPSTIGPLGLANLQWSSVNSTSIQFFPPLSTDPDVPPPGLSGTFPVAPAATTTYTAVVTGSNGKAQAQVTVTYNPQLPFLAMAASPSNIIEGQSTKLSWQALNITSLSIDNGLGAQSSLSAGSVTVSPATTTTYTATGVGPQGTVTATATVNLPAANQLAVSLKANPPSIGPGASTSLQWAAQNAASLTIDNGVGPLQPLTSGSAKVSPKTNTTYTITATDAVGNTQTSQVNVRVDSSGDPNQIKHIIIFVQENRSFDNYFGQLGAYRATKGFTDAFDGTPVGWAMPDKAGVLTPAYHFSTVCHENLPPSWNQVHSDLDATCFTSKCIGTAKMDRFLIKAQATTDDPDGHRAIGYYNQVDLPYYYDLATQFATSDRWFSPLLGPTVPNRMYLFTGSSFGHIHSDVPPPGGFTQSTIFQRLRENGVSWRYYYQDNTIFLSQFSDWPIDQGNVYPLTSFFTDVQNESTLPEVLFIERAGTLNLDEHPNNNIQKGAAVVEGVINALMSSPSWASSVFILTYDEGGGLADHVPPAVMPPPDNIAPITIKGDAPSDFSLSGFRVPLIVVSPWVKRHYVSHVVRDSTAMLKFIETRFGIPSLTARDAIQDDMYEFFNFSAPDLVVPSLPVQPTTGVCSYAQELVPGP